jgi:hypothetical protein
MYLLGNVIIHAHANQLMHRLLEVRGDILQNSVIGKCLGHLPRWQSAILEGRCWGKRGGHCRMQDSLRVAGRTCHLQQLRKQQTNECRHAHLPTNTCALMNIASETTHSCDIWKEARLGPPLNSAGPNPLPPGNVYFQATFATHTRGEELQT